MRLPLQCSGVDKDRGSVKKEDVFVTETMKLSRRAKLQCHGVFLSIDKLWCHVISAPLLKFKQFKHFYESWLDHRAIVCHMCS